MNSCYHLAMILVVWVAVCADAAEYPTKVTRKDVRQLNQFLEAKKAGTDADANLALIEQNLDSLEAGAKRAAQAILALRDIEQCNQDVLTFFVQVDASGLKVLGDHVGHISSPLALKAGEICGKYIEQLVGDKYARLAADDKVVKLIEVLGGSSELEGYVDTEQRSRVMLTGKFLKKFVEENSSPISGNRANFDTFLRDNIVHPCKVLSLGLGRLYKQAWLVAQVEWNWSTFRGKRSKSFKDIIFAYQCCGPFLSMGASQMDRIFHEM